MCVGLRETGVIGRRVPPCARHGDVAGCFGLPSVTVARGSARLLRLWLAAAVFADAQCVVVAVAGCPDGVADGVSVQERDDLGHFSAVPLDGCGLQDRAHGDYARRGSESRVSAVSLALITEWFALTGVHSFVRQVRRPLIRTFRRERRVIRPWAAGSRSSKVLGAHAPQPAGPAVGHRRVPTSTCPA